MADVKSLFEDWQSKMAVPHCFWHMVENQLGCDVVFEVGSSGQRIGAHVFVLMSRSSFFFKEYILGPPSKEIVELYSTPDVFTTFLKYLYTGMINLEKTNAGEIQTLAEKYNVGGLIGLCLSSMIGTMKPESFCSFLKKYESQLSDYLRFKAFEFIFKDPEAIFDSDDFVNMPREFLEELLDRTELDLEEEKIYETMIRWASHKCKDKGLEDTGSNQRSFLGNMIYNIRFPCLDQNYFSDHVSESGVLDTKEEMQLLKYYLNPQKAVSDQFKFNKEKRVSAKKQNDIAAQGRPSKKLKTDDDDEAEDTTMTPYSNVSVYPGGMAVVNRFSEVGTGWGFRGTKKDAIAFTSSKNVVLEAVLIYGNCKKAGNLDVNLTLQLNNGSTLATRGAKLETNVEESVYEIMFDVPVTVLFSTEYHVILSAKGDSGFYGKQGMEEVSVNGVTFTFKNSKYSTNNTTVGIGQIAGFKFRIAD